ncbi:hypothetical protein [Nitrosopumilus adriaticus]|uniref:Uncharacterized protein n=1 Tax=Nitrosopumilus adriaticus TaxID=1580092 RepID=A0A0D5C387_9ARCH|nr:hypothetical protein [Nitrosopumilus adriaticus]AJW71018.1 hypothetical protein NADRNF5_1332 [Nitrosopumilus adriaticus]
MSQYEPNLKTYERERIVLEIIRKNPDLHHNALMKLIVPEFMAKTTFEKTRDMLIDKEIITVITKANMKFYTPSNNFEVKSQHQVERNTTNYFHDLKSLIKRLDTDYPHKDIDEKINMANLILRNLLQTDNGFTILDAVKNPKKTLYKDEHLEIQQLIHKVFEIIRNDPHSEIIFPAIVSYLEFMMPQNSLNK